ncbi:hypothetical protein J6590_044596 [Homalodisca vitripennis]|nr:hypothetical protein J6590_044596 [Homalodisca vitripennis]
MVRAGGDNIVIAFLQESDSVETNGYSQNVNNVWKQHDTNFLHKSGSVYPNGDSRNVNKVLQQHVSAFLHKSGSFETNADSHNVNKAWQQHDTSFLHKSGSVETNGHSQNVNKAWQQSEGVAPPSLALHRWSTLHLVRAGGDNIVIAFLHESAFSADSVSRVGQANPTSTHSARDLNMTSTPTASTSVLNYTLTFGSEVPSCNSTSKSSTLRLSFYWCVLKGKISCGVELVATTPTRLYMDHFEILQQQSIIGLAVLALSQGALAPLQRLSYLLSSL